MSWVWVGSTVVVGGGRYPVTVNPLPVWSRPTPGYVRRTSFWVVKVSGDSW